MNLADQFKEMKKLSFRMQTHYWFGVSLTLDRQLKQSEEKIKKLNTRILKMKKKKKK